MKKVLLLLLSYSSFNSFAAAPAEWQADAQDYDQHSKQQYDACMRHLKKFDLSDPTYKTVVELGCNTARVSHTLAQKYPEKTFIAIDPDKDAIELVKEKYKDQPNLIAIAHPAQTYDLHWRKFSLANLVACYHVMHWIKREELPNVFANIAANLETNGVLDVSTSAKQEQSKVTQAVLDTLKQPKWWFQTLTKFLPQMMAGENRFTLLTPEELIGLATNAGLQVKECGKFEECFSFDSKKEFGSFLHTILQPHGIKQMSEENQQEFIDEVVEKYCNEYNPAEDRQKIEYRFFISNLTAYKPENVLQEEHCCGCPSYPLDRPGCIDVYLDDNGHIRPVDPNI